MKPFVDRPFGEILPSCWMNYRYKEIDTLKAQALMHRMTIVDTCETYNGFAMRFRFYEHGNLKDDPLCPCHDKIIRFAQENGEIVWYVADMETDRLPGHPEEAFHQTILR